MLPVFSKLNVNLTVRNHALGNNPCYAYDACVETHMGDDLDLLTWEQVSLLQMTYLPDSLVLTFPLCFIKVYELWS